MTHTTRGLLACRVGGVPVIIRRWPTGFGPTVLLGEVCHGPISKRPVRLAAHNTHGLAALLGQLVADVQAAA
jgi:hypothetical protein